MEKADPLNELQEMHYFIYSQIIVLINVDLLIL